VRKPKRKPKQPRPKPARVYSPDAEMAQVLYEAAQEPQPPHIDDIARPRRAGAAQAFEAEARVVPSEQARKAAPKPLRRAKPKHKPKQKKTEPKRQEKPGPDVMLSSAQIKEGLKLLPKLKRDPRRWKQKYQDLRKLLQTTASDKTLGRYIRGLR
jgi:hypothetical protein